MPCAAEIKGREHTMSMTSRERVMKAIVGEEVDYAPVANPIPCITAELQDKVGVYFPAANFTSSRNSRKSSSFSVT